MGSEWVFPFPTRLARPYRTTHSDPHFREAAPHFRVNRADEGGA